MGRGSWKKVEEMRAWGRVDDRWQVIQQAARGEQQVGVKKPRGETRWRMGWSSRSWSPRSPQAGAGSLVQGSLPKGILQSGSRSSHTCLRKPFQTPNACYQSPHLSLICDMQLCLSLTLGTVSRLAPLSPEGQRLSTATHGVLPASPQG